MTAPDVLVAGAGIVGAACAREIALRGLRVRVLERGVPGGGATAAGMGHLVVLDGSDAELALTARSRALWDALAPTLPEDAEWDRCGTLWVAVDDGEMAEARRKAGALARHGVAAEVLGPEDVLRLEPALRRDVAGGLLVPGDAVLYPPAAAAHLLAEARRAGAEVVRGSAVERLEGRRLRLADGTALEAAWCVNAAGAHAAELTQGLPIRWKKGHLVITDRHPGFVRRQLVELGYVKSAHADAAASVAFNVQPRRTGQVLIGSSRQIDARDPAVEPGIVGRMLDRALEFLPGLARLSAIRTWTGFRAATPDGLPLIGTLSAGPGLVVAAGHEGLGITTALATAELVADLITGRPPALPAAAFRPGRFPALSGAAADA